MAVNLCQMLFVIICGYFISFIFQTKFRFFSSFSKKFLKMVGDVFREFFVVL